MADGDGVEPLPGAPEYGGEQFECGYVGAGPRNLATAILWHRLGDDPDEQMAEALMQEQIVGLDREGFELALDDVDAWITAYYTRPEWRRTCERVVIGILLREPQCVDQLLADPLAPELFETHRAAYQAILHRAQAGESVDLEAVLVDLDDGSTASAAGGLAIMRDHYGHIYAPDLSTWTARLRKIFATRGDNPEAID